MENTSSWTVPKAKPINLHKENKTNVFPIRTEQAGLIKFLFVGFTLQAKFVSNKSLTQAHLRFSSTPFRKLEFTPNEKVYY